MRRGLNILAVCGFLLGLIVLPTVHLAALGREAHGSCCSHGGGSGDDAPDGHDTAHCPLCQLAQMPLDVALPTLAPAVVAVVAENARPPVVAPAARPAYRLPFSRGPPA